MSVTPLHPSHSAIVTRLRAAGCVFAEDEAELILATPATPDQRTAMVEQRVRGLPLEHVLGWAEFCGLRIAVDHGVFVPRRRTEFLVREAVARSRAVTPAGAVVVDLCCGSGAVGVALAEALDGVELHAADVEPAAVRCARRNIGAVGGRVHQGDLFAPLPPALRGRIDVLAANVPYVPTGAVGLLPAEARVHEPLVALDGGADGLDVLRRLTARAADWLAAGGSLFVETTERQIPAAVAAFAAGGLLAEVVHDEDLHATVVIGTRSSEE